MDGWMDGYLLIHHLSINKITNKLKCSKYNGWETPTIVAKY